MTSNKVTALVASLTSLLMVGCANDSNTNSNSDKADINITRIDRVGRPEITNFVMRVPDAKVAYNAEDSFAVSDRSEKVYRPLFVAGIKFWDEMDGTESWAGEEFDAFADMLLEDYLVVDISKPCDVNSASYLSIERAMALGIKYYDCGGRTPNEDVVDQFMTYLVGGFNATERIRDGADAPADPATNTFPYLRRPVTGI
jgi:hypothetical protein